MQENQEKSKTITLLQVPFTGLGNFGGFRGNRWLKNRIQIFKQFVIPSLQNQSSKNFILWCSWRPEEKKNPYVKELVSYLDSIKEFRTVHTFHGICFYDDKYPDDIARERLLTSLHGTIPELLNVIGECSQVLVTLQPSDDLYASESVSAIQDYLRNNPNIQAIGFKQGYIINYQTKEVADYTPTTNPPFYTIRFPRDVFADPLGHAEYTALKKDVGKYPKGTPIPSHEYVADSLQYAIADDRGFMVGVHGENVSTNWNIPFRGDTIVGEKREKVLKEFGILDTPLLKIPLSIRKIILRSLPHSIRRKLRYWWNEKLYNFLRK